MGRHDAGVLSGIDRGCDFMRDETVIEQNAIVTAEATASIAIQKSIHGIYGSKVLVSGFGKCGKAIARVFSAMGAPCHGDGKEKTGKA